MDDQLFKNLKKVVLWLEDENYHTEVTLILCAMTGKIRLLEEAMGILFEGYKQGYITREQSDRKYEIGQTAREYLEEIGCDPWSN